MYVNLSMVNTVKLETKIKVHWMSASAIAFGVSSEINFTDTGKIHILLQNQILHYPTIYYLIIQFYKPISTL